MKCWRLLLWWCSVVWWCGWCEGAVVVPRCCGAGRALGELALLTRVSRATAAAACAASPAASAPSAPEAWAPRIYAPARGTYLEPGRLPPHWRLKEDAQPECEELRVLADHSGAWWALLANNGSLMVRGGGTLVALPPARYCAEASAALVCAEDLPTPAAAKCCAAGAALQDAHCVAAAERGAAALAALQELANGTAVALGWPACAHSSYGLAGRLGGARLEQGALWVLGAASPLAAGGWCADSDAAGSLVVLSCEDASRAAPAPPSFRHALYGAGLAIGALFLAATLAVSLLLPAAHHALHWRCQTHYVAALMVGDTLLAITQLAGDSIPPTLCRGLAVCMHFLFLSAFFWLNTMCFNIWWTFRDFRPTSLERGQEWCRLRLYQLYAWGGPLALAGTAAALDAAGPAAASALRPRFGEQRCWFYGDLEILVYFFGPVGVLLLVNLVLFVSTTRQLTCGLWRRDEVKSTSERSTTVGQVCGKLVVVMGVTWGADVVSWAAGGPQYVWLVPDIVNALQGVLIFAVVGCQPAALGAARRWLRRPRAPRLHSSSHLPSCGDSLTHTTPAPPVSAPAPAHALSANNKLPLETVC